METATLSRYKKEESDFFLGRRGMNAKYPAEFEVYMMSLELVDGDGETTLEYFSFPVMPFQITKSEPTRNNIKKSASGTTVIQNDSFIPQEITIKGDFGRGFKLIGNSLDNYLLEGVAFKGFLSNADQKNNTFDPSIKTGFGAIKILQNIVAHSNKLNVKGLPYRLYLYNMALSESYLVSIPPSGLSLTQEYSKNMIWEYSLTFTIISPLEKVRQKEKDSALQSLMIPANIEKETETVATKSSWFLRNSADIIDFMKKTSNLDVHKFLEDFVAFVEKDYPNIVSYYHFGLDVVEESFNNFENLMRVSKEVDSMIYDYRSVFTNCEFWEIVDHFSDIQRKLDSTEVLGRWSRSSETGVPGEKSRRKSDIQVEYIQKQLESIERISRNSGSLNSDDTWVDIAIDNNLNEEKYTSGGGVIMNITFKNNVSFQIKNIVDSLNGDNIYGKDMLKKMTIENEDYSVLTGFPSLLQTFDTILNTMKGSIPEFPGDGTSNDSIGTNTNLIGYPMIFRNLLQMFQKDDRFSSVDLLDLKADQDQIFMVIRAKTKIGKSLTSNVMV